MKKILLCAVALASALTLSANQNPDKKSSEAPVVENIELLQSSPVRLEGSIYLATPANTRDGYINLRQFPRANSRSLTTLSEGDDYFYVRKVKGSKFYAVLYSNSYSSGIKGYVNGGYIQLVRRAD